MIRPPFGEMGFEFAKRQDPDLVPKRAQEDSIVIRRRDLAALAGDVDFHVKVWLSGGHKSPTNGIWGASLLELDVNHSDLGLDATLVGLTDQVSARVTQLLGQDDERRESHLPLLLRLWLEDQAGRLGAFLESAAVLVNWEYELDAC